MKSDPAPSLEPQDAVQPAPVRATLRDTKAWHVQVWISFGLALGLCAIGLAWLPGTDLDRTFMVMGYIFCLTSVFAVAKDVRDRASGLEGMPMWRGVVACAFAIALGLTAWGLWRMAIVPVWKAYLLVAWLFLISSAFTLAKTLRDAHDLARAGVRNVLG